jgi:hypothetical protein
LFNWPDSIRPSNQSIHQSIANLWITLKSLFQWQILVKSYVSSSQWLRQ